VGGYLVGLGMGSRGPKPLPANVHALRGNPSKKSLSSLLDDVVRPDVAIPKCPGHLSTDAKAEWKRITEHLERLGLVSEIDRAMLTGYCVAWGRHVAAERRIKELDAKDTSAAGGHIGVTPSGYQQISVWLQISNRAMEQLTKFAAEFGMSPAARSRVTASDPQLMLPGVDDKPQEGGWGTFK
jgi:P27 family predicted phage terminase small subunit